MKSDTLPQSVFLWCTLWCPTLKAEVFSRKKRRVLIGHCRREGAVTRKWRRLGQALNGFLKWALSFFWALLSVVLLGACNGEGGVGKENEVNEAQEQSSGGEAAAKNDSVYVVKVMHHSRGVSAAAPALRRPAAVVGAPDAGGPTAEAELKVDEPPRFLSLGCGGELTLAFGFERLTNGEGPDLEIVEFTDNVEPTRVDISTDGRSWRTVGEIGPGRLRLDISAVASRGETFRYVRLSDLYSQCEEGAYPGAEIDSVKALNWQVVTAREVRFTGAEPPFTPTLFIPDAGYFRIEVIMQEPTGSDVQSVTYRPPGGAAQVEMEALVTDDPRVYRTAPIKMKMTPK